MNPTPIDYAGNLHQPWLRRRKVQRKVIALTIVLAIIGVAWLAPHLIRQIHAGMILRRCQAFTADEVCFEGDPAASPLLLTAGGEYRNELDHEPRAGATVASYTPRAWVELMRLIDPTLKTFRLSPPLVFMHERRSPDGNRQLLILRYIGNVTSEGGPTNHVFDFDLIDPTAWPSVQSIRTSQSTLLCLSHPFTRLRFAQPDPSDASHFQFQYETEEGKGMIDGWLRNGGELNLEFRDGPEKGPSK